MTPRSHYLGGITLLAWALQQRSNPFERVRDRTCCRNVAVTCDGCLTQFEVKRIMRRGWVCCGGA